MWGRLREAISFSIPERRYQSAGVTPVTHRDADLTRPGVGLLGLLHGEGLGTAVAVVARSQH
jgi:hypothetical protein